MRKGFAFQTNGLSLNWILLPKYESRSIYRRRAEFGAIRYYVRGYPLLGGIIPGVFTTVELEWLGQLRSEPSSRSPAAQVEDDFSFRYSV